VKNTV